jgi:hypothetical protein
MEEGNGPVVLSNSIGESSSSIAEKSLSQEFDNFSDILLDDSQAFEWTQEELGGANPTDSVGFKDCYESSAELSLMAALDDDEQAALRSSAKEKKPKKNPTKPKKKKRYNCPDFKKIPGINPPFIVDGFKYKCEEYKNYFLT